MSAPVNRRNAMFRIGSSVAAIGGAGMIGSQCMPEEAPAATPAPAVEGLIEAHRIAFRAWSRRLYGCGHSGGGSR